MIEQSQLEQIRPSPHLFYSGGHRLPRSGLVQRPLQVTEYQRIGWLQGYLAGYASFARRRAGSTLPPWDAGWLLWIDAYCEAGPTGAEASRATTVATDMLK